MTDFNNYDDLNDFTQDTDDVFPDLDDEFTDSDEAQPSTLALFIDDSDGLPTARRAFVCLLKNWVVPPSATRWSGGSSARTLGRSSQGSTCILDLHLGLQHEVAFKRQAANDGVGREFPTLLHDTAYTREETILLAFLRVRFQSERASGHEDVTVDRDEMLPRGLISPRPRHQPVWRCRQDRNAVDNLIKAKVLGKTNDEDRLRVSPVIAVLLPLPRLHELFEWLMSQNGTVADDSTDHDANLGGPRR